MIESLSQTIIIRILKRKLNTSLNNQIRFGDYQSKKSFLMQVQSPFETKRQFLLSNKHSLLFLFFLPNLILFENRFQRKTFPMK